MLRSLWILRSKIESGLAASSAWKWLKWWLTPPANLCGNFVWGLGFDFGVEVWYSEKEEGPAPGRLHIFGLITASMVSRPLAVIFYSLSLRYERAAKIVLTMLVVQVTTATIISTIMQAPFNPVFRLEAGRVREIGSDGLQGRKIAIY